MGKREIPLSDADIAWRREQLPAFVEQWQAGAAATKLIELGAEWAKQRFEAWRGKEP